MIETMKEKNINKTPAILRLGFRPFFLCASLFAVIAMLLWMAMYDYAIPTSLSSNYPIMAWHGHEMIYGYAMAVVAGFLLTASKNWTGIQLLKGWSLLGLVVIWAIARIIPFIPMETTSHLPLIIEAIFDNVFILLMTLAVLIPIIKVKMWRQVGVLSKLFLILGSNIIFYLGLMGVISNGISIGLYSGLLLIVGLVLTLARRIYPYFVKNALQIQLKNWPIIDRLSLATFFIFWIAYILSPTSQLTMITGFILFVIHLIRLIGWYNNKIWTKPLLWGIYLAYAALTFAFALVALQWFVPLSIYIPMHAFAVGGIGMMTLALMPRVSLGHTGRSVYQPPCLVKYIFFAIFLAYIFRVIFPIFDTTNPSMWIFISQIAWIVAFSLFFLRYFPILASPRVDGKDG